MVVELCSTLGVAAIGAFVGKKLKLPAAFMTGALLIVIIYNFIFMTAYFPASAKPVIQMVAGAFIAFGITMETVRNLKNLIAPMIFFVASLTILMLGAGFIMVLLNPNISYITAFLSCCPGGLSDITLLGYELGADTAQVATLQTLRMVTAICCFPGLARMYVDKFGKAESAVNASSIPVTKEAEKKALTETAAESETESASPNSLKNCIITALCGLIGGSIGHFSGFPAGSLAFSMVAVAIYNIKTANAFMPPWIRKVTQIMAGALIGSGVVRADILNMKHLILPFIIVLCEYLILNFIIGPLLSKLFHVPLFEAMLACTPAGASDIALIASDLGGDSSQIAVFHVVRLVVVVTVFPLLIQFIVGILA